MAAITGAWRANLPALETGYDETNRWGSGINSIHNATSTPSPGRNIAPGTARDIIDPSLTDPFMAEDYGYADEDSGGSVFSYGVQTGTDERPGMGEDLPRSGVSQNWPEPGISGAFIRSINRGATVTNTPKQIPHEDAAQGWINKATGDVNEPGSGISDSSQYEMQTSMRQLNVTRIGSQRGQSETRSPISTRVPGMRLKFYSGQQRHADMTPKGQDAIVRPFWARTAGTGYREWMQPNELYVTESMTRNPPLEPVPVAQTPLTVVPDNGYTDEDMAQLW